jgi:hypothetical protein
MASEYDLNRHSNSTLVPTRTHEQTLVPGSEASKVKRDEEFDVPPPPSS